MICTLTLSREHKKDRGKRNKPMRKASDLDFSTLPVAGPPFMEAHTKQINSKLRRKQSFAFVYNDTFYDFQWYFPVRVCCRLFRRAGCFGWLYSQWLHHIFRAAVLRHCISLQTRLIRSLWSRDSSTPAMGRQQQHKYSICRKPCYTHLLCRSMCASAPIPMAFRTHFVCVCVCI